MAVGIQVLPLLGVLLALSILPSLHAAAAEGEKLLLGSERAEVARHGLLLVVGCRLVGDRRRRKDGHRPGDLGFPQRQILGGQGRPAERLCGNTIAA